MIYSASPLDWRDLQDKVADVFRDMGFDAEVEKYVEMPRGGAKIDVYARDKTQAPELVYVCECKHWTNSVPQEKIHALRTVVAETGANYGLLIAKSGFQSGSFAAANQTNIRLLDWQQFQDLFLRH